MTPEKLARLLRELQSDLDDLVRQGAMTPAEANEWTNAKADYWTAESEAQG
jgi:hypothetical protein